MWTAGKCYDADFTEQDLLDYKEVLERRALTIRKQMYEVAKNQLDFNTLKIQRLENYGVERYDFGPMEKAMREDEMKGVTQDCKIKDELQSYNIMHNDKYLRLQELQSLLEIGSP